MPRRDVFCTELELRPANPPPSSAPPPLKPASIITPGDPLDRIRASVGYLRRLSF